MPKFETVKPGDELWDAHKYQAGNTTVLRWGNWRVRIISIDEDGGGVMADWNGNGAKWYSRRWVEKLRRKPKEIKESLFA